MYKLLSHHKLHKTPSQSCRIRLLIVLLLLTGTSHAFSEEELKWFESDQEEKSRDVNEGKLHFLQNRKINILHSDNIIDILPDSIKTGWVSLKQCYRHLDKLPEVDITYQYRFMDQLTVLSKRNIDNAIIRKQTINLINISDNAEICIAAKVRVFYQNPDGSFSLVNGPYHRRFLDGYYPYHVSLTVNYPAQLLQLVSTIPASQPGFTVKRQYNQVSIDTVFEGILNTEIIFSEVIKEKVN